MPCELSVVSCLYEFLQSKLACMNISSVAWYLRDPSWKYSAKILEFRCQLTTKSTEYRTLAFFYTNFHQLRDPRSIKDKEQIIELKMCTILILFQHYVFIAWNIILIDDLDKIIFALNYFRNFYYSNICYIRFEWQESISLWISGIEICLCIARVRLVWTYQKKVFDA